MILFVLIFSAVGADARRNEESAPRITEHPTSLFVRKNSPATLHCRASGFPIPEITVSRMNYFLLKLSCWQKETKTSIYLFIVISYLWSNFFATEYFLSVNSSGGSRGGRNRRAPPLNFDRLCFSLFSFVSECFKISLR